MGKAEKYKWGSMKNMAKIAHLAKKSSEQKTTCKFIESYLSRLCMRTEKFFAG